VLKVGLVGFGYWGPNLARVFQQTPLCELSAGCDRDPRKLEAMRRQYPQMRMFDNVEALLDSDVDAVVIATNISTHYDLAREALQKGKHVLVEKPLADTSAKALHLADVIWDLAVHDVSILLYWLGEFPVQAFSFGRSCVQPVKYDVAFLSYRFPSGIVASCEVSWLSPQKMRRTCIVGTERMVVYDDTEPSEKLKIYDRGVSLTQPETFGEFQLTYRMGDMVAPSLENTEPLLVEAEHFLQCIQTGQTPRTDGQFGADVVRAIELAANCKQESNPELLDPVPAGAEPDSKSGNAPADNVIWLPRAASNF
jgi:predicted dehydrogenase